MGPQKSRGLYRLEARGSNQLLFTGKKWPIHRAFCAAGSGRPDAGNHAPTPSYGGLPPARRASQTDLRYHGAFL